MAHIEMLDMTHCSGKSQGSIPNVHPLSAEGVLLSGPESPLHGNLLGVSDLKIMNDGVLLDKDGQETNRPDRFYRVTINGFGYGVRITEPELGQASEINHVHLPGFVEEIEDGSAYNFHSALARERKNMRMISVASDGVGKTGERLTLGNFRDHGVKEMGEGRAALLAALVGGEPTLVSGCSMGSAITQEMLNFDLHHGHNLNIYPIGYATAVVPPEHTALFMAALFPLSMSLDTPREVLLMLAKYGPKHVLSLAEMLHERKQDALPLVRQVTSLLGGVALSTVHEVAKEYGGTTVSGVFDPLREFGMWADERQSTQNIHISRVARRGHGMAADGTGGAQKISRTIDKYGLDKLLVA